MLYLALAIVCGATYSIFFKLFACRGLNSLQAIAFNYLTAFVLGLIVDGVSDGGAVLPASVGSWVVAVGLGATFAGAFVVMSRSTVLSGVTLTTVASRVSVLIPVVCSYLLLPDGNEPRWGAVATILAAMVLMFVPRRTEEKKERNRVGLVGALCILGVWLLFGVNNFGLKWSQSVLIAPEESAMFSAVIFLFATLFSTLVWIVGDRKRGVKGVKVDLRSALGGVVLGLANFCVTWGMLRGLAEVPASVFFPVYHCTIVALVAVIGTIVFRERLSVVQWLGVGVAALGIVMFFV